MAQSRYTSAVRLLQMVNMLSVQPLTIYNLSEEFAVTPRTILRDIDAIERSGFGEVTVTSGIRSGRGLSQANVYRIAPEALPMRKPQHRVKPATVPTPFRKVK